MPSLSEIRQYLGGQIFGKPFLPNVDLENKTYVITGANTGLGLECAKHLATLKASKIILGCRSLAKGLTAKDALLKLHPTTSIEVWEVDQSSFASVLAFAERMKTLENLHGLVANAGIETSLEKLKETAEKSDGSMYTNLTIVGSMQHVFAPSKELNVANGKNIFEVLSDERSANMMGRYELSKLMVQMCEKEMAERLIAGKKGAGRSAVVNCVNPGWCATELSRYYDKGRIVGGIFSLIGRTAEDGGKTLVHGVTAGEETHGRYLSECEMKTESVFVSSQEGDRIQKKLWNDLSKIIEKVSPGAMSLV
ncbi:hypothetical protein VTL71DRAFT_15658 [Oculimacula yallundae]|uniref:NAD(P)-binding protein n=1 Tax=Oculimacula yallundae TaxID=86028 RepID=A0ABR4CH90_9HELO